MRGNRPRHNNTNCSYSDGPLVAIGLKGNDEQIIQHHAVLYLYNSHIVIIVTNKKFVYI